MSRRCLALVAAISLIARVSYVIVFMRGYVPNSDADSYYAIGRAVSKGQGYVFTLPFEFVHATAIRPPLYPTVLAGAFRVFGTHVGVAQGVNIVAGCAAAVLGALIGARISGPRAGLCAGIVLALYPPLIANDVTVLVESIAVLLLFATVLLVCDGRTALAGISLGLLMLDRASAQWLVVVIAGWVLWRFGWRHAARMIVIALLVISPWVVRNAVHVGGPVIVATNGFNLNATYSNEARHSNGFVDAYFDPRFASMRVDAADEVDLDAQLRAKALRDLRGTPNGARACPPRQHAALVRIATEPESGPRTARWAESARPSLDPPTVLRRNGRGSVRSRTSATSGRRATPRPHRGVLHHRVPREHFGSPPPIHLRRMRRRRCRHHARMGDRPEDHDQRSIAERPTNACGAQHAYSWSHRGCGGDHGAGVAGRHSSTGASSR